MTDRPSATNVAQVENRAYRLPATDEAFLLGDSMRGVRFLMEFAKADKTYWTSLIRFEILLANGFVSSGAMELIQFAEGGADAWGRLAHALSDGGPDSTSASGGEPPPR